MKRVLYFVPTVLAALIPQGLYAHEGHGHESPLSPGHYVANPEHFIPLALTVAAITAFVIVKYYKVGSKQNK